MYVRVAIVKLINVNLRCAGELRTGGAVYLISIYPLPR